MKHASVAAVVTIRIIGASLSAGARQRGIRSLRFALTPTSPSRQMSACLAQPEGYLGRVADLEKTTPAGLALDSRSGWPADLRLLLDRYPREAWQGHANLGAMA